MEHVLSIVNDFFGNFLAISNYLVGLSYPIRLVEQYSNFRTVHTSRNHVVFGGNHLYAAIKIVQIRYFKKALKF